LFDVLEAGLIRDLIISDGGSRDDIAALADGLGARLVTGVAGRGGQLARGAGVAEGDWLLFLHADTALAAGWADVALAHIRRHPDQAACFTLRFRAPSLAARLVAGWANMRSRVFGLPYGAQGLLISRALYDAVGGYPLFPLMEDVAIARALRGRIRVLPLVASTSAARYLAEGWLRRGARNLWLLARYLLGAAPDGLARRYAAGKDRGD
jgi:hypothetical protein